MANQANNPNDPTLALAGMSDKTKAEASPKAVTPKVRVTVAVPVMKDPDLHFVNSLFRTITTSQKCMAMMSWNQGDSLISRSRNLLFSDWLLRSDTPYFMFWDSDLEHVPTPHCENLLDTMLDDLQKPGIDFVGGLYSVKGNPPRSSSVSADFGPTPAYNTGLHRMLWLSTGSWMMSRRVGEQMLKAYPELVYNGDGGSAGKIILGAFVPYIARIEPGELPGVKTRVSKYLSEDWAFCGRWTAIGGTIWNDSRIILKHYGSYAYCLYQPGKDEPKPEAAVAPHDPAVKPLNEEPAKVNAMSFEPKVEPNVEPKI